MTGLEPMADQVVREAVDAYLEGNLEQEHEGELVFETKNSRYRLMDGVLFSAPDSSLAGAELVGWLSEGRRPVVASAWQPNARAVLVDRKRGRHIIVTSTTRMLHLEDGSAGSNIIHGSSTAPPPPPMFPVSSPSTAPLPEVGASSYTPTAPSAYAPPAPIPLVTKTATKSAPPSPTPIPRPPPIPSRIHPPPRPVGPLPAPTPPPRPITHAAPLPYPAPPPRYALPPIQPPPVRATASYPHAYAQPAYAQRIEDAEDLEVTEAQERPLPLVQRPRPLLGATQRTLLSAQPPVTSRAIQRGALLR